MIKVVDDRHIDRAVHDVATPILIIKESLKRVKPNRKKKKTKSKEFKQKINEFIFLSSRILYVEHCKHSFFVLFYFLVETLSWLF